MKSETTTKPPLVLFQHFGATYHSRETTKYHFSMMDPAARRVKKRIYAPLEISNTQVWAKAQIEEQKRWLKMK